MFVINVTAVNDAPVADDDSYNVNEGGTLNEPAPGVLDRRHRRRGQHAHRGARVGPGARLVVHAERRRLVHLHARRQRDDDRQLHLPRQRRRPRLQRRDGDDHDRADQRRAGRGRRQLRRQRGRHAHHRRAGRAGQRHRPGGQPAHQRPGLGPGQRLVVHAERRRHRSATRTTAARRRPTASPIRPTTAALDSNVATVTITITGVNDPPVAVDDVGTTNEDTVLSVPAAGVLTNDTDPDAGDTKAVVAVNGSGANVNTAITTPKGATLTLNADGSYTYNPIAAAAFQALDTGETDTDTFTYTMQDTAAVQSTATVTITITGVNDAPVVTTTGGASAFTEDGGAVVVDGGVTVTDVDVEPMTQATVTISNLLNAGLETLAAPTLLGGATANYVAPTLTISGSATLAQYQTMLRAVTYNNTSQNPNTTARTIAFQVNDGTVLSTVANKTVSVAAVNDAPAITAGATILFTEGDAAKVDRQHDHRRGCGRHQPRIGDGADHRQLRQRAGRAGHAAQPGHRHRVRRTERDADPAGIRDARAVSGGPAHRHVLQRVEQPVAAAAHRDVDGPRRDRPEQQRDQHDQRPAGQRRAGRWRGRVDDLREHRAGRGSGRAGDPVRRRYDHDRVRGARQRQRSGRRSVLGRRDRRLRRCDRAIRLRHDRRRQRDDGVERQVHLHAAGRRHDAPTASSTSSGISRRAAAR